MANTFSALKRMRQTERRTAVNRMRKSRLKHQIRAIRRAIEQKDAKAAEALVAQTFSVVDRSARLGIIKTNTAARYKSRVAKRLRALSA
jgi:small subunit ribosomal protein S20